MELFKDGKKLCTKCKLYLAFERFSVDNNNLKHCYLNSACRICVRNYRVDIIDNPKPKRNVKKSIVNKEEDYKFTNRITPPPKNLSQYKLTREEYNNLVEKQNNLCAICGKSESVYSNRGIKHTLCIDHHHESGRVRGLLCGACNRGIGLLKEDIKIMESAIEYIKNN